MAAVKKHVKTLYGMSRNSLNIGQPSLHLWWEQSIPLDFLKDLLLQNLMSILLP